MRIPGRWQGIESGRNLSRDGATKEQQSRLVIALAVQPQLGTFNRFVDIPCRTKSTNMSLNPRDEQNLPKSFDLSTIGTG